MSQRGDEVMAKLHSSLSGRVRSPFGPGDALRSRMLCREAWHGFGLLLIAADDPDLTWDQRAFVIQIAERKFGRRRRTAPEDPSAT